MAISLCIWYNSPPCNEAQNYLWCAMSTCCHRLSMSQGGKLVLRQPCSSPHRTTCTQADGEHVFGHCYHSNDYCSEQAVAAALVES